MDAKAHAVRLEIAIDDDLPEITVDGIQIQQVLLNLLRNGVDAMAENALESRILTLHAQADTPQTIRIDISDRGHGVSEEVRQQLFTPFFTTKAGGMGMGLAISRSIITAHGGQLDCVNNPSGGATFRIVLLTNPKNKADDRIDRLIK